MELENYLDRYVEYFLSIFTNVHARVAELSTQMCDAPDFAGLRHAVRKLKKASRRLDHRKAHAERRLKHTLKKLSRHHHKDCACRKFAKARAWVKKVFGVHEEEKAPYPQKWPEGAHVTPRIGRLPAWAEEQQDPKQGHHHRRHHHHHRGRDHHHKYCHKEHKRLRKLIRAVEDVQAVNKKLSTFEQGFISEEGIRDREW